MKENNRMKEDNWDHRSKNMLCKTCMWYVEKKSPIGRCRYNPPASGSKMGFPVVFETDWCGQHKIDENKLEKGGDNDG